MQATSPMILLLVLAVNQRGGFPGLAGEVLQRYTGNWRFAVAQKGFAKQRLATAKCGGAKPYKGRVSPTAVLWNLAAVRRRIATVCYVQFVTFAYYHFLMVNMIGIKIICMIYLIILE